MSLEIINKPTLNFELHAKNMGYSYVIGVDEAGRGPLCGPVVAASVNIPDGFDTSEINDSKKLTAKKREYLYDKIKAECRHSVKYVSAEFIDVINIREATKLAMRMVINDIEEADLALIDGDFVPNLIHIPAQPIIGGDKRSISIAAASILAKVWRDREMEALHTLYPVYNWQKNKGYGTLEHREAIKTYGITRYHRKTFGGVKEHLGG